MADITWIAAHSQAPLEAGRIDAWTGAVEAAFAARLTGFQRVTRLGRHLVLIAWWGPAHAPAGWVQVESAAHHLALFDGMPIGYERTGAATPSPSALADRISLDPALGDDLHPPWALASLSGDRLVVALDPLGFASVHVASAGGLTAWSNSAGIASLFTYGDARPSEIAWTGLLVHGRPVGDASTYAGVEREAGRTVVHAEDRPDGLRIDRPWVINRLYEAPPSGDPATTVRSAIEPVLRSVRVLERRPITIPFSGGRDSRVLAAIALACEAVDRLWTSSPPELDVRIAVDLVERLVPSVPWTTTDKTESLRSREAEAVAAGLDGFWDRALRHHAVTEGQAEITPHGTAPASSAAPDEIRLWGIGGEFARAFYYDAAALADPETRTAAFWTGLGRSDRLVDADAQRKLLVPALDAIRTSYADAGVTGLRQLDLFYVLERIRRLKNRVPIAGRVWPFFALDYVRTGLAMQPHDRVHGRSYEDVVRAAVPAWAGDRTPTSSRPTTARPPRPRLRRTHSGPAAIRASSSTTCGASSVAIRFSSPRSSRPSSPHAAPTAGRFGACAA